MKNMRTPSLKAALLCSSLMNKGGGERIMLLQAQHLNADIYTGFFLAHQTFPEFKDMPVTVLDRSSSVSKIRSLYRRHLFRKLHLSGYDVHIYHFTHAIPAALNHKNNVWYCHAPSRFLYDMYDEELKKFTWFKRILFRMVAAYMRRQDQTAIRRMDLILANSEYTRQRVKKYYGRDSLVVYPPVNLSRFKFESFGDFYLSAGRLDPIKRVDLIVKAFRRMPEKKLVVASGGPDLEKIKDLAKGCPNICILGWVSDQKLQELMGNCIATLYMSANEDFGMTPVESMACGKPCIATAIGGMKETILHKKTGLLVPGDVESVINAVRLLTKERCARMKQDCIERAKLYSEEMHLRNLDAAISRFRK